jgi:hypothetical protein
MASPLHARQQALGSPRRLLCCSASELRTDRGTGGNEIVFPCSLIVRFTDMRKTIAALLIGVLLLGAVGCGTKSQPPMKSNEPPEATKVPAKPK